MVGLHVDSYSSTVLCAGPPLHTDSLVLPSTEDPQPYCKTLQEHREVAQNVLNTAYCKIVDKFVNCFLHVFFMYCNTFIMKHFPLSHLLCCRQGVWKTEAVL